MSKLSELIRRKPAAGWLMFFVTAGIVFLLGLLASSIVERRTEMTLQKQTLVPVARMETRSEKWGINFPRQYERHMLTGKGDFLSREGGNVMIDMLERDPRLVILWAGYGFSKGYNQARGHVNTIEDIRNILRTNPATEATCWTCKSPDVIRVMEKIGPEAFYSGKWVDLGPEIVNSIGCLDCHNPDDMTLRISRPALIEALARRGEDINDATHQEMRTLVCAQCHVEYYFKGQGKYLTFPWDKGLDVESAEEYYDEIGHVDWTHQLSRAPMLKAQHPDYELWQKGIHAQRGVACADCHMPYRTEGGVKFTDHRVMSPLANIANSCQVCHRESEETLRQNVFERQDKIAELRVKAEENLVKLHIEANAAWDAGATEEEMAPVLKLIRHAQWRWDYAAAGHGSSFHAPLEVARILGTSIDKSQEGRLVLSRLLSKYGVKQPVPMPDISLKEKAQEFIGLNMEKLIGDKRDFLKTYIPKWEKEAQIRESDPENFR